MVCPKCAFALAGGEVECPRCGVILGKAQRRASPPPLPAESLPTTASVVPQAAAHATAPRDLVGPDPALAADVARAVNRGRVLSALLGLGIVLDLAGLGAGAAQYALLDRVAAGLRIEASEAMTNDAVYGVIGYAQLAIFLVTGAYWLFWLHRSYANLTRVGVRTTRFTTGWAVGYWFVPFANLVRPYQITKDLWLRSLTANSREAAASDPAPPLIGFWWLTWIVSGVVGRVFMVQSRHAKTVPELLRLTVLGLGNDGVSLLLTILALVLVGQIKGMQKRWPTGGPGSPSGALR